MIIMVSRERRIFDLMDLRATFMFSKKFIRRNYMVKVMVIKMQGKQN